jgi:hypothetical protein
VHADGFVVDLGPTAVAFGDQCQVASGGMLMYFLDLSY